MSVTYPADPLKPYGDRVEVSPTLVEAPEPFVPVYARRSKAARGNGGKIRTWMILVPVGVITLGGIGAMLVLDKGGETLPPLAEPAATAPVVGAMPLLEASAPVTSASTPAPARAASAPTPVLRPAPPVRRAATPTSSRRATPPTDPVVRAAPPAPAASSTSTLNAAPTSTAPAAALTPTPAPAQPPAPIIVVAPLD